MERSISGEFDLYKSFQSCMSINVRVPATDRASGEIRRLVAFHGRASGKCGCMFTWGVMNSCAITPLGSPHFAYMSLPVLKYGFPPLVGFAMKRYRYIPLATLAPASSFACQAIE